MKYENVNHVGCGCVGDEACAAERVGLFLSFFDKFLGKKFMFFGCF